MERLWASRKKGQDVPGCGVQDGKGLSQVNKGMITDFAKDGEEIGLPRAEEGWLEGGTGPWRMLGYC